MNSNVRAGSIPAIGTNYGPVAQLDRASAF